MSTPPFQLQQLDHVVLRVKDLGRMRDFYCQALGCHLEKIQADIGLWQLRAGSALIDLLLDEEPTPSSGVNMDHFCLRIDPFDEALIRRHLASLDVAIGTFGNRGGAEGIGPSLYLYDPEGNKVELKGPPA